MAGTKSKSQTQVSERQVPADSVPTARRARMQKLGTYVLQGPASDPNRLMPVAEIAERAYKIMDEEREAVPVAPKEPRVGIGGQEEVVVAPKPPKAPKAPAKPKNKPTNKKQDGKPAKVEVKVEEPAGEILPEATSDVKPGETVSLDDKDEK